MRTGPRNLNDVLVEPIVANGTLLIQQVPNNLPDAPVRMSVTTAVRPTTADVTLDIGTVRDDVKRGDPVPKSKRKGVDFASFGIGIVEGIGGIEHAT